MRHACAIHALLQTFLQFTTTFSKQGKAQNKKFSPKLLRFELLTERQPAQCRRKHAEGGVGKHPQALHILEPFPCSQAYEVT
jgi:hypothetical protein